MAAEVAIIFMNVLHITKVLLNLFILRAKPSDIPYSKTLLLFLSIVFLLTKSAVYLWFIQIVNKIEPQEVIKLSYFGSLIISVVWILILFAILRSILSYYNLVDRFLQVAISFVAVDCFLTALFLLWLSCLTMVQLPLAPGSLGSIGIILGFVLMMYWQFMVYIHILIYSMNISVLKAGVFTLFYMLLQHNLSEVLLNVVITVKEL